MNDQDKGRIITRELVREMVTQTVKVYCESHSLTVDEKTYVDSVTDTIRLSPAYNPSSVRAVKELIELTVRVMPPITKKSTPPVDDK